MRFLAVVGVAVAVAVAQWQCGQHQWQCGSVIGFSIEPIGAELTEIPDLWQWQWLSGSLAGIQWLEL
jgi:hypothetical protein